MTTAPSSSSAATTWKTFLVEKATAMVDQVDLEPAREFLQEDWGRRSLAGWLHHKFGIAVDPAELGSPGKVRGDRADPDLGAAALCDQGGRAAGAGRPDPLSPRAHPDQPARYDRDGLARWASERFHAVIDADELRPLLRSEIEPFLLEVAHKHYKGAKLSDELDQRLEAAFGPVLPSAKVVPRPIPRR